MKRMVRSRTDIFGNRLVACISGCLAKFVYSGSIKTGIHCDVACPQDNLPCQYSVSKSHLNQRGRVLKVEVKLRNHHRQATAVMAHMDCRDKSHP